MKKAAVITCFESNEERTSFVVEVLKKKGYDTTGVTTDFSHISKRKRTKIKDDYIQIETKPYRKNLSVARLLSHKQFSKKAFRYIESYRPDLLWICVPANSLIYEAEKYKKKHPNVKIVIDVIDMWPESLPIGDLRKAFPFALWKNIRKNSIDCADALVTECDYYKDILKNEYSKPIKTICWARDQKGIDYPLDLPKDKLSLLYLGSINNIIDIDEMGRLIASSELPVELHVIGDGEKKDRLLDQLKDKCILHYHGTIYDPIEKMNIFSKCHAGFNIYKEGLYIGLTVKSIDYFAYGLPIINSIQGDTHLLIEKYDVGFNVDKTSKLDAEKIIEMRLHNDRILNVYDSHFTKEVFVSKAEEVIDSL